MKHLQKKLLAFCANTFGVFFIRLWMKHLSRLCTIQYLNKELWIDEQGQARAGVYAIWHNRLFMLASAGQSRGMAVLISASQDGQFIRKVVEPLGYTVISGSSSKGGTRALREMIRQKARSASFVFTVDGPRGPRYQVKEGAIFLAAKLDLPIYTVTCHCDKYWAINSWDGFILPKPGATIQIVAQGPLESPCDTSSERIKEYQQKIQQTLQE